MHKLRLTQWLYLGLAVGIVTGVVTLVTAEDKATKTTGKVVRLDPKFDELIPSSSQIELLAEGFDWSEGPVWLKSEKALLFSDIPKNTVWKWSAAKGIELFMKPSGYSGKEAFPGREPGCNGLAIDAAGRLILCEHGDRRVAAYDFTTKTKTTLADRFEGKRFNSPNDLTIHSNGDIYFTDPPYGLPKQMNDPSKELDFQGVYRLSKGGKLTLLTKEMTRPNGIALSPDEKTLYVANSDPKMAIWKAFPVNPDGTIGTGKVLFDATASVGLSNPGLPDGLKVDVKGNLFATGPGGVLVFTPEGKHLGTLATGVPTANVGWGDDGSVLYITANKTLCRIKTSTKGPGF